MNPEYVYLLWFHDEEGPENAKATLDRKQIILMVDTMALMYDRSIQSIKLMLSALLEKYNDEELLKHGDGIFSLERQYGGLHFQIVRLWEAVSD